MRISPLFAPLTALVLIGAPCAAISQSGLPYVLPQSFETQAALAAAPEMISKDAGVYLLTSKGFELHRPSRNGYYCLVERNPSKELGEASRQGFAPQCYDSPSSKARMALLIERSKLVRVKGMTMTEAGEQLGTQERFRPSEPGIVYMASALNSVNNPLDPKGAFATYPPHVMFLAPNRDDQSVSGGLVQTPGGMLSGWPFLPGPPRDSGLIIVPLDRGLQDQIFIEQADLVATLGRYIPSRRLYLP